MPRDISCSQEIVLPVGQGTLVRNVEKVKLLGIFVGKPAPEFAATTLDGKSFKLADLRGKVVLVDFWATWCGPCVAELPNLKKLHDEYADQGLVVVSISFDRSADATRRYAAEKQMSWTQIWAEKANKGPLAELYGVNAIPATFLIGPEGKVVAKDLRGDELQEAVQREVGNLNKHAGGE
jgi:peroxiredoxin